MIKIIKKLLLLFFACGYSLTATPTIKKATDVFKRFIEIQKLFSPVNLAQEKEALADQFAKNFKNLYEVYLPLLRTHHTPFLQKLTDHQINEAGHQITDLKRESIQTMLINLYESAEHDMPQFIRSLEDLSINQNAYDHPHELTSSDLDENLHTNVALCSCIFGQNHAMSNHDLKDNAVLFEVANKFVHFCFEPQTFPIFQDMLLQKKYRATAELLVSTMHQRLARTGWHNWSTQCLKNLRQVADTGKKIVYVAGGSDLYQLITHGIYTIKIIDPQLPSQPKYYADEWAWIMVGDIGDQIIFEAQGIVMTRISYQEEGKPFKARLEKGQIISITPSKTVWLIATTHGKQLGSYTLERRFVEQTDFNVTDDHVLLMSFNELFFIALPDALQGWQIEPSKFSDDLTIFVKQLHAPVTKAEICNMRTTSLLNATDFKYLPLGLCIN